MDPETPPVIEQWRLCGRKFPSKEVIYFSQVVILYAVIFIGLYFLTTKWNVLDDACREFLIALVWWSLGYMIPAPQI